MEGVCSFQALLSGSSNLPRHDCCTSAERRSGCSGKHFDKRSGSTEDNGNVGKGTRLDDLLGMSTQRFRGGNRRCSLEAPFALEYFRLAGAGVRREVHGVLNEKPQIRPARFFLLFFASLDVFADFSVSYSPPLLAKSLTRAFHLTYHITYPFGGPIFINLFLFRPTYTLAELPPFLPSSAPARHFGLKSISQDFRFLSNFVSASRYHVLLRR